MNSPKTVASKVDLPPSLAIGEVYHQCQTSNFPFKTTKEIEPSDDIIAQDRAIAAINMGLGIKRPGYNIYVAGSEGTGKSSVIKKFLEEFSSDAPLPNDWVYLYNFASTENPHALQLPIGKAKILKKMMEKMVKVLREEIPIALQSEEYENAVNGLITAANERKAKLFSQLEKKAKEMCFQIKSSRLGIETVPIVDGRALSEKDYNKLSDPVRTKIEAERAVLEPEVLDFARKVRKIETEAKEEIDKLRNEVGQQIIDNTIHPIREEFRTIEKLSKHLDDIAKDVLENLMEFVEEDERESEQHYHEEHRDKFVKYLANVFIDNSQSKAAPVIIETNPTYYNLFGKIEKNVEHGMYLTDFTMIKSGSIHKANGGYLVLNAIDILRTPSVWDTLKRVLKNRLGFIEDMGEQYSLLPTSGLRPQPIPLDLKVILIGSDEVYRLLFEEDEEFQKIFKIKAEFDYKMKRNPKNIESYVSFIATRSHREGLLPFSKTGVAAIIEASSRSVEDQQWLSTQFGEMKDLTIESDFIARQHGAKLIQRSHVETAIAQKLNRLNLTEQHLNEMLGSKDLLVTVDGQMVGQVNGLAVYDYADHSFGKVCRITCTTHLEEQGIINIEKSARMSGRIHEKSNLIITGYLKSHFAQEHPLGISASICFEQSYGPIDGDSASSAEMVAVLSALGQIPVMQNIAITGSMNQFGEIQSVGGINEKIEGFLRTCRILGRNRKYAVIIPDSNRRNLMVSKDTRDAVKKGFLSIYPCKHIQQVFEIATGGTPLGILKSAQPRRKVAGDAFSRIQQRLKRLHQQQDNGSLKPTK